MEFVFDAIAQKVSVKLLEVIFRDRNLGVGIEDGFHDFGVSSDFLFIAAIERLDLQFGE